jgi:NADH dehydrogenase
MGVEVILNARVTKVDELGVMIGDTRLAAQNIFWAAGVQASPLAKTLGVPLDRTGRVIVNPDLSIPGHPEVFVIGDMAAMTDAKTGQPVPGVAQGAIQSGKLVGQTIRAELNGEALGQRPAFTYHDRGSMAAIGKAKAVAQIGKFKFGGFIAWLMWSVIHVLFLVGFRNRLSVLAQWMWNYVFSQRGARLITGKRDFAVKKFREVVPHKLPFDAQSARPRELAELSAQLHVHDGEPVAAKSAGLSPT